MTAMFFASGEEMRDWLQTNHATAAEVWVGIYKKGSGKTGVAYREAVDQGLCFGWIDSLTRRIDDRRYMIRFTPRRPGSNWTAANVARVEELRAEGLMHEAGVRAFERRQDG